jgi:hypothetical protein
MLLTESDYTNEVKFFLEAISELGDDLCGVILYGSIVKHTVRPGLSDLLDAVVVVQSRLLADEASYYRAIDLMIRICGRLQTTGVPFHPFHYFALDSTGWSAPALYVPTWTSDRYSKIVAATDVRHLLRSSDTGLTYMRGWYFTLCRRFRRRVFYLTTVLETSEGVRGLIPALRQFTRNHPQFACFACDRPVDRADALAEIAALFPGFDVNLLNRLSETAEDSVFDISTQDAKRLLEQASRLNESLCHSVASWVEQNS